MKLSKTDLSTIQKLSDCTGLPTSKVKEVFLYLIISLVTDNHFSNSALSIPYLGTITLPPEQESLFLKKEEISFQSYPFVEELSKSLKEKKIPISLTNETESLLREALSIT